VPHDEYPDLLSSESSHIANAPFRPYIPSIVNLRELTLSSLILGTLLGVIFGAASLYLVLKVGLTISASVPIAIISITLFRVLSKVGWRNATILERTIVQSAGSAGESIAFGLGVTMPAIILLGFDLDVARVILVAILGGTLGILIMIPLRRVLITQHHDVLKYPEGTSCAEVLKAGTSVESRTDSRSVEPEAGGKIILAGFGISFIYQVIGRSLYGWKDVSEKILRAPFSGASISAEISPTLLGIGYIIGPRSASLMCAGGVFSFLVLIPFIKFFGGGLVSPLAPGFIPISDMGPYDIRRSYVLFIGVGTITTAGIIAVLRLLPSVLRGVGGGLKALKGRDIASFSLPRTDQDLSNRFVVIGILILIAVILIIPQLNLQLNLIGALMIISFGFMFVSISSRLTGELGTSSTPITGITVAAVLLTCFIFLIIGWTEPPYYVTAISIGAIICIASSSGGTTSQDLKTGFLIGSTPKYQQIAMIVGAITSALILGPILLRINDIGTVYVPRITFVSPRGQAKLASNIVSTLQPYTDTIQPPTPGNFHVFYYDQDSKETIKGLDPGDYLIDDVGRILYKLEVNFPVDLRANTSELSVMETLKGPQSKTDSKAYYVWLKSSGEEFTAKYLVNEQGIPVYLVDPGINGVHRVRPDGSIVPKFAAPTATLLAYIIKGVFTRRMPWGLVFIGVAITLMLELAGISPLPFAVGMYLPLSTSIPIFVGGMIHWLVERNHRRKQITSTKNKVSTEGDANQGLLIASGYIAGGAVAGVIIALMAGVFTDTDDKLRQWATDNNSFYSGSYSDLLSLVPFCLLILWLYLIGTGRLFSKTVKT